MRLGLRSIFAAAAVAVALGCTSPTIPLPPPSAPSYEQGSQPGTYVLKGQGYIPGAFVIILDGSSGVVATVASDGTWTATIVAKQGDTLQIWEDDGGQETSSTFLTLK